MLSNHSPQFLDNSGSKLPIGRVLVSDSSWAQQDTMAHPVSTEEPLSPKHLRVSLGASVSVFWMESKPGWGLSEALPCAASGCTICSSRNQNKKEQNTEAGRRALNAPLFRANLRYGLLLSSDLTPSGPSVHLQTWTWPICVCYCMNTKWLGSDSLGRVLVWHATSSRFGPQIWSAWTGKKGICPQFQCLGGQGHPILTPILGQKGSTLKLLTF